MNNRITTNLEIKTLSKRQFEGYGSIFGNVDYGNDVVMPGAFKGSLQRHSKDGTLPMMLWQHNPERVPGKWLEMSEDSRGLYVKGELADTDLGNEVHTLLGMKAVRGLSIGYSTVARDYTDEGVRLLKAVELHETSIVSIAMNPLAEIEHVKSRLSINGEYVPERNEIAELKRECEHWLRSKGFNKKLAMMYVGNLFREERETLDSQGETLDDKTAPIIEKPKGETPEEIEVMYGLNEYAERTIAYELAKLRKTAFT